MTRCEFLIREQSHCTGCSGWFCTSKGRKKKVGDTAMCNDEELWRECVRYLQSYPKPPEPTPMEEITAIETFDKHIYTVDVLLEDEITDIPEPEPPKPEPPKPRVNCPYLGFPPPGVKTCCGLYCYAINESVRTGTTCRSRPSWRECIKRLRAVKRGVPYADT